MTTSPSSSEAAEPTGSPAGLDVPSHAEVAARRRIRQLRSRIEAFERLADAVRQATVWDHSVYEQAPDGRWLAIDRDHYQDMINALAQVDSWRPWERTLERRLGEG